MLVLRRRDDRFAEARMQEALRSRRQPLATTIRAWRRR
jgi:hypothetical protein